jgi:hypothetical protein
MVDLDHLQELIDEQEGLDIQDIEEESAEEGDIVEEEHPGAESFGVLMNAFATGFYNHVRTPPGSGKQNSEFKVIFKGVTMDGERTVDAQLLENLYDWHVVMEMVLASTEDFNNVGDLRKAVKERLTPWLASYQGFGLLCSLVDMQRLRHVFAALLYTTVNWNEAILGPVSQLAVFDKVRKIFQAMGPGRDLASLVPHNEVWVEEWYDGANGQKVEERRKKLVIYFRKDMGDEELAVDVEVEFIMEKKLLEKDLELLAAEAIAKSLEGMADVAKLPLPKVLKVKVAQEFKDVEWVRQHWDEAASYEEDTDVEDEEYLGEGDLEKGDLEVEGVMKGSEYFNDFSAEAPEDAKEVVQTQSVLETIHWVLYCGTLLLALLCC